MSLSQTSSASARIVGLIPSPTMTPEQEQALQEHVQAIARILYENTPPDQLKTLGGIEQAVRDQMQKPAGETKGPVILPG